MNNMNGLQVANHSHKMNVDFHTSRLNGVLRNGSISESEMSAEDMKNAIISLVSIVKSQEGMIQELIGEVNIAKEERNDANEEFLATRKS